MRKKVNITRDLESRRKIARKLPQAAKAKKPKQATPQNEQTKTQTEETPAMDTSGGDKKPGRKTEGKP